MYRKLSALFAAVMMLVGCASPAAAEPVETVMSETVLDADGLWTKMCQAVDGRTASAFTSTLEMGASVNTGLLPLDTSLTAVTEIALSREDSRYFGSTELKAKFFGKDLSGSFQVFAQEGTNGLDAYFHFVNADKWYSKHSTMVPTDLLGQYEITACTEKWMPKNLTLADTMQKINGTNAYVLTCSYAAEDMLKSISSPVGEISFDKIDISGLELRVTHYVDAQTYLPVQIEIQYQGIGAVIGNLISKYAGDLTGGMASSLEVDVTTYREVLSNLVYGPVEVPQVPAEGVQNSKDMAEFQFSDIMKFFG